MANFETKNIKEIHDDIIARYTALRNKYGDNITLLEKGTVNSLAWAYAGVAATLWTYGLWIYQQCFPQTCCLIVLKLWGALVGVEYKNGQKANLQIKLTNVTATSLSTQTVYRELTKGLTFKTISQAPNENGEIVATVECTQTGPAGNLEIGSELSIANPVNGIPEKAEVTSVVILGTDNEETETYRARVLQKFRNKAQSGGPLDYYTWGMEVDGIIDILPYVLEEGTVTLFPVAAGSGKERTPSGYLTPNPFPEWENGNFKEFGGSGQMLALAYSITGSERGIHDRRPTMAKVELKESAIYTPFTVEITGLGNILFSEAIKNTLTEILDKKRPHIVVLDYPESNAKINTQELSAACIGVLEGATFTTFLLKDCEGNIINETTLGIGCLPYLDKLYINGILYYSADPQDEISDTEQSEPEVMEG